MKTGCHLHARQWIVWHKFYWLFARYTMVQCLQFRNLYTANSREYKVYNVIRSTIYYKGYIIRYSTANFHKALLHYYLCVSILQAVCKSIVYWCCCSVFPSVRAAGCPWTLPTVMTPASVSCTVSCATGKAAKTKALPSVPSRAWSRNWRRRRTSWTPSSPPSPPTESIPASAWLSRGRWTDAYRWTTVTVIDVEPLTFALMLLEANYRNPSKC